MRLCPQRDRGIAESICTEYAFLLETLTYIA